MFHDSELELSIETKGHASSLTLGEGLGDVHDTGDTNLELISGLEGELVFQNHTLAEE